ncbi:MAG: hypothetical protein ABIK61_01395 [candidate division WOR-3 bacterium]
MLIIFFIQVGYFYVVKLGMSEDGGALERERLIFNEIYWANKWKKDFLVHKHVKNVIDTANKYYLQSVNLIIQKESLFVPLDMRLINKLRHYLAVNCDTMKKYLVHNLKIRDIVRNDSIFISNDIIFIPNIFKKSEIEKVLIQTNYNKLIKVKRVNKRWNLVINENVRKTCIDSLQNQFEHHLLKLRFQNWLPSIKKYSIRTSLIYFLLTLLILVEIFIIFHYSTKKPFLILKSNRVILFILLLWIIFTYILMVGSERIDPSWFPPFEWIHSLLPFLRQYAHLVLLVIVLFWGIFVPLKFCSGRKEKGSLSPWYDRILYPLIIFLSLIFIYLIFKAIGQELAGIKFVSDGIAKQIIPSTQKLLLVSLEVAIGAMWLILTLIYIFFPLVIRNYFQVQERYEESSVPANWIKKLLRDAGRYLGWNDNYQYFFKEIITKNSTQFIIGLSGFILVLFVPFLFSSAGYYSATIFAYLISFLNRWTYWLIIIFLFLVGWTVWHWMRIDVRSRHWQFFLPLLIVLIILTFWFPKSIIERIPSWAIQLQLRTQIPLYHELLTTAIPASLPLIILWLAPIIQGLNNPVNIIAARTTSILQKILLELKNHTILFGFGDLGHKIGVGIVKRDIKPSLIRQERKFNFAEIYSTRRNEVLKVCKDVVIVDKKESVFDETYTEPIYYGKIGLCDVEIPRLVAKSKIKEINEAIQKYPNDIVLLGIVGDCKEPALHDKVNFDESQSVILAARDDTATFPVFNEIYKLHNQKETKGLEKKPRAIVGTESSLYGAYLEWRCVNEAIYFVYPAQLRGIIVGEIISDDMINQKFSLDSLKNIKVLVLGSGNKLYYILHTLAEDLKRFFDFSNSEAENFLQNNVVVVSNEEFIKNNSIDDLSKSWVFPNLKCKMWRIRAEAVGFPNEFLANNLFIPVILEKPSESSVLKPVIENIKPSIIVIASMTSEETAAITHETLLTLERIKQNKSKEVQPHIIVGTRRKEWYQIRDAITCWRMSNFKYSSRYPIQSVDTVIDYYDDAGQMMLGLYETLQVSSNDKDDRASKPIEISSCTADAPGYLAQITADLAGLRFTPSELDKEKLRPIPNFHNYRSVNVKLADFTPLIEGNGGNWSKNLGYCFFSGATLVRDAVKNIFEEKLKTYPRSCVIGAINDSDINSIEPLLNKLFPKKGCLMDQTPCFVNDTCPRRRLCPLDIFRRHLKIAGEKEKRKSHYRCNHLKILSNGTFPKVDYQSYAQIALCGYGSENPGAMARAINLLLFRDVVSNAINQQQSNLGDEVLDITYTRSFGCYCPKRSYNKIYGKLQKNPFNENKEALTRLQNNSYINAVLIRPAIDVGGEIDIDGEHKCYFNQWLNYAQALHRILPNREIYRVAIGHNRNSNSPADEIILIYRYNKSEFDAIESDFIMPNKGKNPIDPKLNDPNKFLYLLRGFRNTPLMIRSEANINVKDNNGIIDFKNEPDLKDKIFYENQNKKIVFKGIMSQNEREKFVKYVKESTIDKQIIETYRNAINNLYKSSQRYCALGYCNVRETTCPFEKIRDEAERYGIDWKDVTPP